MYLKWQDPGAENYNCIDLNTGMIIPGVQEANDETGEFTLLLYSRDLEDYVYNEKTKKYVDFKFKGNIKLVKKEDYCG